MSRVVSFYLQRFKRWETRPISDSVTSLAFTRILCSSLEATTARAGSTISWSSGQCYGVLVLWAGRRGNDLWKSNVGEEACANMLVKKKEIFSMEDPDFSF